MTAASSPVRAIVGPGRSGTTWAGTIVDSCPDVVYRFEPFHRMSPRDARFHDWFEKLKRQAVSSDDIPQLYDLLRVADPLTNKAPFFSSKSYPMTRSGRELMWPIARVLAPARWMYRRSFTPAAGPPVVFKEVTFIKPLRNLVERTEVPVIYLVRHPCATVLSEVRGEMRERKPNRQRRLRELLLEHAPSLIDEFPEVISGADVVSRTALLWRCEVETCATLVRDARHGMLMTYEQLADDAYSQSEVLFNHLGLPFTEQTKQYLDSLHAVMRDDSHGPRRTGWGRKYFSVYRNPKTEKDSWKRRITAEEQRKIEAIVQGCPVIEQLAGLGRWW